MAQALMRLGRQTYRGPLVAACLLLWPRICGPKGLCKRLGRRSDGPRAGKIDPAVRGGLQAN
jgi:hypothetical protein